MFWKTRQIGGVVWKYLNQPILASKQQAIWNPNHFWYAYQIQLLEHCWQISGSESHSNS
jgi:hypothetical protein